MHFYIIIIILMETYFPASTWEDFVIFWKALYEVSYVVDVMYPTKYRLMNIGIMRYRVHLVDRLARLSFGQDRLSRYTG